MEKFDPSAASPLDSGIFGLPNTPPHTQDSAQLIFLPVPWEVTTSYHGGTSQGTRAIFRASKQVDLFDAEVDKPYEAGMYMLPESPEIEELNGRMKKLAQKEELSPSELDQINQAGRKLNDYVYRESERVLERGQVLGVLGGDHSVPLGALQAVASCEGEFGILHVDAHSDTRKAFEGFQWSHASILFNVMESIKEVSHLAQVGIRDFCEEEFDYIARLGRRASFHSDLALKKALFEGETWAALCQKMIQPLPEKVWVSFDIDGLDPRYCPHTGTPVPGGLDFSEANYLIGCIARSGRKIIGFDLCEVAPALDRPEDDWDANVGARLLYKLSAWTLASQKKRNIR